MSKENVRRNITREKEKYSSSRSHSHSHSHNLSKHLKRVYPVGIHKTTSFLSLSSLSLTLSHDSFDSSSFTDSSSTIEQNSSISLALRFISPLDHKRSVEVPATKYVQQKMSTNHSACSEDVVGFRRCNWITNNSDKVYVQFHDECWGVPVYDDNQLFELLALAGMLMDFNWTEILKRKSLFRETFARFDPNIVAKMGEKEIMEIASKKEMHLTENRVSSIVSNAKCILKVAKEYGSFSAYMWGCVNYKPTINRYRNPRNVPLRTPKAEMISKDLLKHGFRMVGPVIVYSFMQAAGMSIDHLVDCFRFRECVNLAERPWRHV